MVMGFFVHPQLHSYGRGRGPYPYGILPAFGIEIPCTGRSVANIIERIAFIIQYQVAGIGIINADQHIGPGG